MKPLDILLAPWAIVPAKLAEIQRVYAAHARGERADLEAIAAKMGEPLKRKDQGYALAGDVAVIPIDGVIMKRANLLTNVSGGASTELVARDLRQAVADPKAKAIVLQIDSPGGTVDGTQALAAAVADANQVKTVVAYADGMMASAAYWIGCAADRVVLSGDTTSVGSIGVVASHVDVSGYEQRVGIKTTEIYAGKFKRIASEHAPLTDAGRDYMQGMVDQLYSVFVREVAKYRGRAEDQVLEQMADGRVFIGRQGVKAGLADAVLPLEQLLAQLSSGAYAKRIKTLQPREPAGAASFEERCLEAWKSNPAIAFEFIDFESFVAYQRAIDRFGNRARFHRHEKPA